MKRLLFAAIAALAVTACETTEGVDVMTVAPANNVSASQLRNIAVLGFNGQNGEGFTSALESKLAGATFNGQRYFTVVDRQTVRGLTNTRGSSAQDVAQVIAFGDSLGVTGVFFGDISTSRVDRTSRRETRNECVEWDGLFDCERRQEKTVTCYDFVATFSAIPKLVDVRSGDIVYTSTKTEAIEGSHCDGDAVQVVQAELLSRATNSVIDQIRNDVAPSNRMVTVELIEVAAFKSPVHQAQFDGAIAFAKEGRFDRACGTFLTLGDVYPDYLPVVFNQAVCAESQGDFETAFETYAKLDASLVTPDARISNALARVQGQLQSQQSINE